MIKILLLSIFPLFHAALNAETFIMQDGAKIEGEISGEADDSVLVKTNYGTIFIKRADIAQIIKTNNTEKQSSSEKNEENLSANTQEKAYEENIETINSRSLSEGNVSYVFSTVVAEDGSAKIFYFRDREIIATEKLDTNANLIGITGNIPDRTFTEYYASGEVKAIKTMRGGKQDGLVRSFYKDGTTQIAANYKNGLKNGIFYFYAANGNLMIEANYTDDKLDGPKKDYDAKGNLQAITWYKNDVKVENPEENLNRIVPNAAAATEKISNTSSSAELVNQTNVSTSIISQPIQKTQELSPVQTAENINNAKLNKSKKNDKAISVKARKVARGVIYSFYLNNRYIGKARLDKDFNVLMLDGNIPDGSAKLYSKGNLLQQEFLFKGGEITDIILFDKDEKETAHYLINGKRMAVKIGL